jgi:hypothetical protein
MSSHNLKHILTSKPILILGGLVLVVAGFGLTLTVLPHRQSPLIETAKTTAKPKSTSKPTQTVEGLQLDTSKSYGDAYASGVLPVGDKMYSSTSATKGSIYTCSQYAQNLTQDKGGAGSRGPWFSTDGKSYDINKKAHVSGAVKWVPQFSQTVNSAQHTIVTNDLPSHPTGVFPIASSDAAYSYDRNPNKIQTQSLTLNLPTAPTYGQPQCMGGEVGIMLTGVALFNGFDAGGRDAGAWEVQDDCGGHPQVTGEYHYHTLSSCITDTNVSTIIGYALDGFPITGPKVGKNSILTTADLDECHGIFSNLTVDGKSKLTYHYVMTQDFPYSVSCFRSTPTQISNPAQARPQPKL